MSTNSMVRNVTVKVIVLGGLLTLHGCGEKIDSRQAHVDQGLIYKKDVSDPFTGTLTNVATAKVAGEYGVQFLPFDGVCDVSVKNGMFSGMTSCKNAAGKAIAEISYLDGHQDGPMKIWTGDGHLLISMGMRKGFAEGPREEFNPKSGKIISRINYVKGRAEVEGEEKHWDASGENLLVDLTWAGEKKTGYVKKEDVEETYRDGLTEGVSKTYKKVDMSGARYLASEATYVHGNLEGKKTYWDAAGNVVFTQMYRNGIVQSQTRQGWKDGKIIATESAVNISSGGIEARDIDIQKDGKEHAVYDHDGITSELDIDWVRGEPMKGSFEDRKQNRVIASYQGVANKSVSSGLVKDGIERRWDEAGNLTLEVTWNKGVATKLMTRTDDGKVFNIDNPASESAELQPRIATDQFSRTYL